MKTLTLWICLLMVAITSQAQENFKFHYIIKPKHINSSNPTKADTLNKKKWGSLYLKIKSTEKIPVWQGYIAAADSPSCCKDSQSVYRLKHKVNYEPRKLYTSDVMRFNRVKLKVGEIKINDDKDTLKIQPWYYEKDVTGVLTTLGGAARTISNDQDYIIVIDWESQTDNAIKDKPINPVRGIDKSISLSSGGNTTNKFQFIRLHYRYYQFTATSIPFRYNVQTQVLDNDFLNANLAFLKMWGHTTIFRSKFLDSRNYCYGFGPYVGASTIEDKVSDDETVKRFGINYGLTAVTKLWGAYGTLSFGWESNFETRKNHFNPYIGAGFGFDLVDLFEPKNDD